MTKRVAKSVILNGSAVGGLSMFGFGLWTMSQPAFWITAGLFLFVASLYLCMKE